MLKRKSSRNQRGNNRQRLKLTVSERIRTLSPSSSSYSDDSHNDSEDSSFEFNERQSNSLEPNIECEGVTKKMLKLLKLKKTGDTIDVDAISALMMQFQKYKPSDFARDCRSLEYLSYFKATELRIFLHYGCIVFLKGLVNEYIYQHWLLLHCAVRLLSNDDLRPEDVDLSEKFINEFVRLYPLIYGEENVTYNVHVLLHITYFVRLYGPLHKFSMFKFENFIQTIKKFVRKAQHPLQQISNRLKEQERYNDGFDEIKKFNSFVVTPNEKNSFIAIKHNGKIIPTQFIRRFATEEGMNCVEVKRCLDTKSFYTWPLDSKQLGEISYERLSTLEESFPEDEVFYKYCRIPYENIFVLIPILHTSSVSVGIKRRSIPNVKMTF